MKADYRIIALAAVLFIVVLAAVVLFIAPKPAAVAAEEKFYSPLSLELKEMEFSTESGIADFVYPKQLGVKISLTNNDAVAHSFVLRHFDSETDDFVYLAQKGLKGGESFSYTIEPGISDAFEFYCNVNCPFDKLVKGTISFR